MVDKKLTCLLSHLCCLLVFAKCMQVGHTIQTDAKGNRGKDIEYTEEQFERFLLGPIPEQHPSSPPPVAGSGSVPESAASTSKDHLMSTFSVPREQEVERFFQIEKPFHVEDSLGPDVQTKDPTQKKGRGSKIMKEEPSCVMTKRKCQRELNSFWEACGNAVAQVAWSKYRTNILKLFKRIAVAAFKEGKDLQEVLENYRLRNKRVSSWLNSLIDHPILLLEGTIDAEKDPGLHKFITDWAASARETLAAQRGGQLNFTEKVNWIWRLKPATERLKSECLSEGPEPYSAGVGRARIRLTEDHNDVKRLREKRQRASMKADGSLNRDRDRKGVTSRQPPLQEPIIKDETSSAVDGRHDVWSGCGDEIRDEWKTYATEITKSLCKDAEKSLKSGKALESVIYGEPRYNRPPTWHNSIIDHPTTLVEDRPSIKSHQAVHELVSQWARKARNELAGKRELRYMQKLVGSDTWTLKPFENRTVKEGPDRWRSKEKKKEAAYDQQFARAKEDHFPSANVPTEKFLPHVRPPESLPLAYSRLVDHRLGLDSETERSKQTETRLIPGNETEEPVQKKARIARGKQTEILLPKEARDYSEKPEQPVLSETKAATKQKTRAKDLFARTKVTSEQKQFWKTCKSKKMQREWRLYDRSSGLSFWRIVVPAVRDGLDVQKSLDKFRLGRAASWFHGLIDHPIILVEDRIDRDKEPHLYLRISQWATEARDALAAEKGGNLRFTEKVNGAWKLKPIEKRPTDEGPEPYRNTGPWEERVPHHDSVPA